MTRSSAFGEYSLELHRSSVLLANEYTRKDISLLKTLLLREVSDFCECNNRKWKLPIQNMLQNVRREHWRAVFFGGTLRSLILSRLLHKAPGRPRDVDIVVVGQDLPTLEKRFHSDVARKTRFGGLHIRNVDWEFDIWPLHETYGLKRQSSCNISFQDLPRTTFLNIESIAVDVYPLPGRRRRIFSGDDQFFKAILDRTIDINNEENPFPELCVVRALVFAVRLRWKLGRRLLHYIAHHGIALSENTIESVQRKHYGCIQLDVGYVRRLIRACVRAESSTTTTYELPFLSQLTFWPEEEDYIRKVRMRLLQLTP
jgi:hypothetical protein